MATKLDWVRFFLRSDVSAAMFLELYTRYMSLRHHDRTALRIQKIDEKHWEVNDGTARIHTFTPYRSLSYSKSIAWRLHQLATAYGYKEHYDINKNDVVIDIGANVGEFSLFSAGLGAKVYAFEPDPDVFKLLEINTAAVAPEARPQCFHQAISDTSGQQTFYLKPMQADSTLVTPIDIEKYQISRATTVRLDDFIESQGFPVVNLVKCDAEGAEPEVVASAERMLSRVKMFALDCGPERNGQPTWREVTAFLEKNNFEIVSNPKQASRMLVAARNKAF